MVNLGKQIKKVRLNKGLNLTSKNTEKYIFIRKSGGTFEERDDSKWLDYTFLFSNNILERNLKTCFVKANKSVNIEPVSTDVIELKMYKIQKQTWIY